MTGHMHDLSEEFPDKAAEIERLTREDPRFEALRRRNHELWLELEDIQRGNAPDDDTLRNLEVERLGVLDEMSLILRGGKNAPSQARKEGRF
jgi:uncharacterized protein YdcH (DUF465 family)